jgi:hypothetical protein
VSEKRKHICAVAPVFRKISEHIARLANQEDGCKGRFWEGRFKSQALLDERALLTCMTYVDLNPIRANMAKTPEASEFTSIQERIRAFAKPVRQSKKSPKRSMSHLMEFGGNESLEKSENTIAFHLDDYIALVGWTGRAIRTDKLGSIPKNLPPVFERLNMSPDDWLEAVKSASHRHGLAKGLIARLKLYANRLGEQWIRGQSYCKVFYQFAPVFNALYTKHIQQFMPLFLVYVSFFVFPEKSHAFKKT